MNRLLITLAAASALVGAIPASAQEKPAQGCKSAEARQFDFWIGEWRVTENGKLAGHNRIEPLLEGCACSKTGSARRVVRARA